MDNQTNEKYAAEGGAEGSDSDADIRVVLFDGVCNLCSAWVRFVINRDPHGRLKFASLQSDFGRTLVHDARLQSGVDAIVFYESGAAHIESTAVLLIVSHLSYPWPLLKVLMIVPRVIRDWVYRFVAKHRYAWFGKTDVCMLPAPEHVSRFLDGA